MNEVTRCSLEEAIELVKDNITPDFDIEEISVLDALGRVIAEDIVAPHNQPPFPRSPLDGYAMQSSDSKGATLENPVVLKVVDEVMAGSVSNHPVTDGEAIRIMTGAPIPEGADCIIRQEETDCGDELVKIYREHKVFENYCIAGEDYKKGQCLIPKKTPLSSVEIGLLASVGRQNISVYKLPEIHLMTTGDELVMPGQPLQKGKIYDSNLYCLGTRLRQLGFPVVLHDNIEDNPESIADQIDGIAKQAKVIITTGGVSVGKKDIMHDVFRILKVKKLFWKMALKPGTPTLCGMHKDALIIGLSGNPFGAVTNLEIFVRPVLAYLTNNKTLIPIKQKGILEHDFGKPSRVRRFVRARYEGGKVYLPEGLHSSGVLSSMVGCNCLIDIPNGSEDVHKGDEVLVWML